MSLAGTLPCHRIVQHFCLLLSRKACFESQTNVLEPYFYFLLMFSAQEMFAPKHWCMSCFNDTLSSHMILLLLSIFMPLKNHEIYKWKIDICERINVFSIAQILIQIIIIKNGCFCCMHSWDYLRQILQDQL